MGVTGLWTVVAPTARPTQLASLNRKRLAVDASIWIYQFLKAVRDKEGNALRNSHVVGFFRRICKLLYFGIKPVFVFDGGAPVLKRETIRRRVRRREGRREDAARTAGKLLAVQVARAAEEEERKRKEDMRRDDVEEELPPDQELVYVEEIGMDQRERQAGRNEKFRRKDQYHLPDLDVSIESMGAPNDPRIMSQAELEDYARHFHSGEDINLYDFSKIDFESPFFLSLPAGDRYNILNAARLRSRLRMGYSKEQLDGMFPDRMAFSKFQIERVKERNELTQRLMHLNGMVEGDLLLDGGGRIAGEKGKEYILVKNEGAEGGWALGVVSNKQGTQRENAIDLDKEENSDEDMSRADSEEDDFEDVAIEGLNRIPKSWPKKRKADGDYDMSYEEAAARIAKKRKAVYEARRTAADTQKDSVNAAPTPQPSSVSVVARNDEPLFVPDDRVVDEDEDDLFEDVLPAQPDMEEDEELQRAIAMSLEQPDDTGRDTTEAPVQGANPDMQDSSDEGFDLQAALAESRRSKAKSKLVPREGKAADLNVPTSKFGGPLPFESMNLGQSLLGKKKSKKIEEDLSGGFDRELGDDAFRKERPPQPMPDWFNAAPNPKDLRYTGIDRAEDDDHFTFGREDVDRRSVLQRQKMKEVIDLDSDGEKQAEGQSENLEIDRDEADREAGRLESPKSVPSTPELTPEHAQPSQVEDASPVEVEAVEDPEKRQREQEREQRYEMARQIAAENGAGEPEDQPQPTMGLMADRLRAEPPPPPPPPTAAPQRVPEPEPAVPAPVDKEAEESDFEEVEWSDSDNEQVAQPATPGSLGTIDSKSPQDQPSAQGPAHDEDEDEDFEDVTMGPSVSLPHHPTNSMPQPQDPVIVPLSDGEEDLDPLSSDEEELMRQLAEEAEEHARFTSALQNQPQPDTAQAMRDFDAELKALRSQQKRDRRDADEVTQTMIQECQALLRHFGLPYITAPMEAEAQCAELVRLGLVDGIVTDDSDIFLFGGTRIYKNMFNAAKYVECYLSSDLEKEFLLDRRKLVRFAHLLGSDYTEGIPGVGPVTALEILTDFQDLEEFKTWTDRVQLARPQNLEDQLSTPFRRKFRKTVQKKLFLPSGFPDTRVDEAYLYPEVDSNSEPFQWGVPDLDKLRAFLMATIGWSQERTDEVLVPVIRDMNKREVEGTQSNITRYFAGSVGAGAVSGGGLNGVRGKGLAMGGESVPSGFGKAQAQAEAMAPRNRTGKESGRMKNAFKRLRGEAEKQRRRQDDGEGDDADDDEVEVVDGLGDLERLDVDEEPSSGRSGVPPTPGVEAELDDGEDAEDEAPMPGKKRAKAKSTTKRLTKSKKKAGKAPKRTTSQDVAD
jgi:DNA excision repair protein ERCC-5